MKPIYREWKYWDNKREILWRLLYWGSHLLQSYWKSWFRIISCWHSLKSNCSRWFPMPQANHFDCILDGLIFYFHKQNYPNRAIRVYMYAWIGTLKPYFTFLTNTFYFIFFRTWWTVCSSFCSSENGEASQLCQKSCWDCCSAFHHKWQGI